MSELRRDPITGRWVIVDTDNPTKPHEYENEPPVWRPGTCPFCYGNENLTPPEIASYRDINTPPNTPGWHVRTVSNKFPALQIEGDLDRRGLGMYDLSNGIGAHEVVVETPYHNKDLSDLTNPEVEDIIRMLCQRSLDLAKDKRFKYIMIFKNFGPSAGASMEHPHTQIIALPMVPKNVKEELLGAEEYYDYRERCIFCDVIRQEVSEKERIITDNKYFLAFCPYASRFPFEIWIMPKKHNSCFMHLNNEEIPFLAVVLKDIIARLKQVFDTPAYNFIIHTSPLDNDGKSDSYHWHLEFMPKLTRVAGFEWGTGFYLVPTPPEVAVKFLREAKIE